MKKHILGLVTMSVAISLTSCGEKKEKTDIIARKHIVVRAKETRMMGNHSESRKVQWIGNSYTVDTDLKADKSLPIVSDGEQKYYDNRATVKILRKDGSVWFTTSAMATISTSQLVLGHPINRATNMCHWLLRFLDLEK